MDWRLLMRFLVQHALCADAADATDTTDAANPRRVVVSLIGPALCATSDEARWDRHEALQAIREDELALGGALKVEILSGYATIAPGEHGAARAYDGGEGVDTDSAWLAAHEAVRDDQSANADSAQPSRTYIPRGAMPHLAVVLSGGIDAELGRWKPLLTSLLHETIPLALSGHGGVDGTPANSDDVMALVQRMRGTFVDTALPNPFRSVVVPGESAADAFICTVCGVCESSAVGVDVLSGQVAG